MNDWQYAQNDPREQLAKLHFFSMKKLQGETEIENHHREGHLHTGIGRRDAVLRSGRQADQSESPTLYPS